MISTQLSNALFADLLLQSFVEDEPEAITVIALLTLGIGLVKIYRGRSNQRDAKRLQQISVTDVSSITPGPTAVSGVVRPADDVLERPATDGDCLAFEERSRTKRQTEEVNREQGETNDIRIDTTVSSSSDSVPFYVEDETGSVLVSNSDTPTLHLRQTDSVTNEPDDGELADRSLELESELTRDSRTDIIEQRIKYYELLPGDEVVVFGRATDTTDSTESDRERSETGLVIVEDDNTGELIVTHHDKEWLIDRYSSNTGVILGVVVSVIALIVLLYVWVPL